jgi:CelD/BcsL family acetyltransferase involved in cellulose biosynthesis
MTRDCVADMEGELQSVEPVSTDEGLLALRAGWERLLEAGAGVTPFDAWWMTYRAWRLEKDSPAPFVLVARDANGSVAGILPLGVRRLRRGPFTWRVLDTIAPRRLDFVDVIARPENRSLVLATMLQWLARHWREWDELRLSPIREDAALAVELQRLVPRFLEARLDAVSTNLAVTIPPGARGWEDVCDGETRRGLRRTGRRLEASGFAIGRVSSGYSLDRALDALVDLHERRRGEHGQLSRLASADRNELALLVGDAVAHGGDLWVMEHDGAAVAAQLTLRRERCVSHYRLAYDSAFRGASPGIGLLIAAIDDAVKSGATEYDFGFGAEEYKRRWANLRRAVYRLRISNKHPGRLPRRLWSLAIGRRPLRHRADATAGVQKPE